MPIYCTYIIVYTGNKLPPFYIGSTSLDKIHNGYMGTVSSKQYRSLYKQELQLNRHLFTAHILTLHETRKQALERENKFHRSLNVINNCLYINKMYASGSGLVLSGANNPFYGKQHTEKTKATIGRYSKERMTSSRAKQMRSKSSSSFKGKKHSEESNQKMRKARPRSQNKTFYTNGKQTIRIDPHIDPPEGFWKGRTFQTTKGFRRCTNGIIEIKIASDESLPPGFWYGSKKKNVPTGINDRLKASGKHSSQVMKHCEHCDRKISAANFARWHGNQCKNY